MFVGISSVIIGGFIGTLLGLVSGFAGGRVDDVIMRLADIQLAFPPILLALAIIAVLGTNIFNVILVISISTWVIYARTIRSSVLTVKQLDYILSCRALGARPIRIMFCHILPNTFAPLAVLGSFEVARVIILEASLGFFGLGVQPPTPTWGNMISEGRNYIFEGWWVSTFPGIAIILTVLAMNLLGDGIRDALDPKMKLRS